MKTNYKLSLKQRAKYATLALTTAAMTYLGSGCASYNIKPVTEGRTTESGALETKVGVEISQKSEKEKSFYQKHKKGVWYTVGGIVVVGTIAALLGGSGGGSSQPVEPTEPTDNGGSHNDGGSNPPANPPSDPGGSHGDL